MKRRIIFFIIYVLILLLCCSNITKNNIPLCKNGIIDLTNYDLNNNKIINLNGTWEFYWDKLLAPEDFIKNPNTYQPIYAELPGTWNKLKKINNKITKYGTGTYRLVIKNNKKYSQLGIKVPEVFSAYELWIDGKLLIQNGKVGKNRNEEIPKVFSKIAYFTPENENIEIILKTSNFHFSIGGIWTGIQLGSFEKITKKFSTNLAFDLLIFGALIVFSFFHFGLFLINKKNKTSLSLAILCLIFAFRTLSKNQHYLFIILPDFPYELSRKIEFLIIYLSLPVFINAMFLSYKNYFKKIIVYTGYIIGILFSLFVIFTPIRIYFYSLTIFEYIVYSVFVYLIIILIYSIYKKEYENIISLIGCSLLILTILNDFLHNSEKIRSIFLTQFGLFIFILCQSIVLSIKNNNKNNKNKNKILLENYVKYKITNREKEVIALIMQGKENKEIGYELNISLNTVHNHIKNIYKKCKIQNKIELINILTTHQ